MSHILNLAGRATRDGRGAGLLHSLVVGGCALALILARVPLAL